VLHLADANGQRLITHTAEPGSPAEAALALLRVTIATAEHRSQEPTAAR
jgi:hypothetical protein